MRINTSTQSSQPAVRTCLALLCVIVILAFATSAFAQNVTQLNVPTTTQLWAGTQDWNQFGLSSVTAPTAGVILAGTAASQFTNGPLGTDGLFDCQRNGVQCNTVRHLWYGDASNGLCRVDPEVDDPDLTQPSPGIGKFNNIERTCVGFIQAGGFVPNQLTYDAIHHLIYAADEPRTANGVIRLIYDPTGDNGQGSIDPIHVVSLMGAQGTRNGAGGCPVVTDPRNGATPVQMFAITLGPDGSVYVGWARNGTIARINHPDTFDPNSDADCASIEVPIFAADARLGAGGAAGHTFGLAWIGHTLFGADNISPWFKENADQCLTPANGNLRCGPVQGIGTEILGAFAPGPQAGITSDFEYGDSTGYPGNSLFPASLGSVVRVGNASDTNNLIVTPQFGGSFCFITGVSIDRANLANETIYIGADCTQGSINGAASIWKVTPQPPSGAPPAVPGSVTASNSTAPGAASTAGAASVAWIPGSNGQALTGFVVRTVLASDGTTLAVPDFIVNPSGTGVPPNFALITGLTVGTPVQFLVAASNSFGTSQFSVASAVFTPFVPTAPTAPTGVVATAGNKSAQVAWSAPSSNGGLPITGYTITAQLNGTTPVANLTVGPTATGVNFTGLTNGSQYNFVVVATNAAGNSPASLPSNAVVPAAPQIEDIAVTMSAPSSVNAGAFVTFTIGVTNLGPGDAPNVTLSDNLPANFVSATTTQGACSISGAVFSCTFGGMPAGASATVKVTVAIGSSAISNSATATLRDLSNNVLNQDPSLTNNTASASVGINSGTNNVSADIQVVGSNNNGGPAIGANVLFTWQIKNNTGNAAAPNVSFETTLPASFQLASGSLNTSIGTCTPPPPGLGGSLSCSATSLPGGQTMIVTYSVSGTQAGTFTTTGKATSGANDPNLNNNSFSVNMQPK
jgi:uncharacterized repeat protein (TIGR01451 family)